MLQLHLLAQNRADGFLHLGTVVNVHRPHVWFTNVHLGVRMLRGQLQRDRTLSELEVHLKADLVQIICFHGLKTPG